MDALRVVTDPDLGRDIVTLGFVKHVRVANGTVGFTIEHTSSSPSREHMRQQARQAVAALPGVGAVDITMTARVGGSPDPTTTASIRRPASSCTGRG